MVQFLGPDVAQVTYKPVIEVSDSKKNEDAVTLKIAGTYGSTEFEPSEIVTIIQFLTDYALAKGLDINTRSNDRSFIPNN